MDVTAAGGRGLIKAHLHCSLGGTYTVTFPAVVQSESRLSISCKSLHDPGGRDYSHSITIGRWDQKRMQAKRMGKTEASTGQLT